MRYQKFWTREAGVVLPLALVRYQKDRGRPMATTYRHNKLYNQAINIMKMGDANVESYDVAMKKMIDPHA